MISLKKRAVAAATLAAAVTLPLASQAQAGPQDVPGTAGAKTLTNTPEPPRPAFYEPPAQIPSTPGTIIRSEPANFLLDPLNLSSSLVTATRVMYSSTDAQGIPIAVTGTVFVPKTAYRGASKRPFISYAPGTQGMADRCAPSRQMSEFVEYEGIGIARTVGRGYAVGMTDYQGLGTPGTHTYIVRKAQGAAVLDMARAAKNLHSGGVDASTPMGLMGYSQGGAAAAAAAEMAPSYAPDLDIKGAAVGAVPADLNKVGANLDGSLYSIFGLSAIVGQAQGAHVDLDPFLNDEGRKMVGKIEDSCVTDLASFAFKRSDQYTVGGQSMKQLLAKEPFASVVAEQRIGKVKPTVPVVINHAIGDDVIPYAVGKQLGSDWCDRGARVTFNAGLIPTHIGGFVPHVEKSMYFFEQRFAGRNQASSCWRL